MGQVSPLSHRWENSSHPLSGRYQPLPPAQGSCLQSGTNPGLPDFRCRRTFRPSYSPESTSMAVLPPLLYCWGDHPSISILELSLEGPPPGPPPPALSTSREPAGCQAVSTAHLHHLVRPSLRSPVLRGPVFPQTWPDTCLLCRPR